MASSYTVTDVTQGFNSEVTINKNLNDIKLALDDTLNRVEVLVSNAMLQNLDMGGFTVNNLPVALESSEAVRYGQLNSLAIQEVVQQFPSQNIHTVDASQVTIAKILLTANTTINFSTEAPADGQAIIFEIRQDATGSRIVTWDARVRFSLDLPTAVLTTTPLALDYVVFRYNEDDDKYDILAINRGFL